MSAARRSVTVLLSRVPALIVSDRCCCRAVVVPGKLLVRESLVSLNNEARRINFETVHSIPAVMIRGRVIIAFGDARFFQIASILDPRSLDIAYRATPRRGYYNFCSPRDDPPRIIGLLSRKLYASFASDFRERAD
jgi:hypothetical protein